jgi:SAM-dependent methyltransferase
LADPRGLAFDELAEDYELGRPRWPDALLDGVDGDTVLDLGAGTGKLTVLLVERFAEVIAVEPLAGMRAVLERNAPRARVVPGDAERIPLDDGSVDGVFVAEAFHWFDSKTAVREIARVLRRGGTLVVAFNEWRGGFEPPVGDDVRTLLDEAYDRLPAPGGPKVQSGEWKRGFEAAPFAPLEERGVDHEWTTDREGVAAYYVSTSSMGALEPDERLALRRRIVSLLPAVRYRLPLTARVFRTVRR